LAAAVMAAAAALLIVAIALQRTEPRQVAVSHTIADREPSPKTDDPEQSPAPKFSDTSPEPPDFPPHPPKQLPGQPTSPPSQLFGPNNLTPTTTPSTAPIEEAKTVVLDLERSAMYVSLTEMDENKQIHVQVENLANITTPYQLHPADGLIKPGQSVDIVLTQYTGVKLHLALVARSKETVLKVAPEIEVGQGKTSDFTHQSIKRASGALKKDLNNLGRQLSTANYEAKSIETWLASPALKPAPVSAQRKRQLQVLKSQVIPILQKQMTYAQSRATVLGQLTQLAQEMHDKAAIHLTVQVAPESETQEE
jgi:hypothetical protein